jgi:alpha-tubulin suppressor-like RCC1 family protein
MKKKYNKIILMVCSSFVTIANPINAQSIACGGWHSLAICSDSTVKGFGENATGQLGDGTMLDKNTPVTVTGLSSIIGVSAGGDQLEAHSLALRKNGTVWAWGSNLYGGLGNGSTNNTTIPGQVLLLSGITAISAGGWHSTALKNDGTVWTWGWNIDGQLGDGTFVDKAIASQVPGLSGVIKIAAGTYHVLALKNDGTVWAWGDNVSGQIGDGTSTDRSSPVQVTGLTNVVSIASGRFFSLAVKNDGTVWTWGENLYGQLGNGTVVNSSVPVQVSGLTGITSAVASTGAFHCMAIKNDNTVWAWGRNTYGNLGDGSVTHRSTPVQMIGISSVKGLAAGTNFSLLYKNDGSLWGCGRNLSGQLGDGTFLQRNTLIQSTALCPVMQPIGIKKYGTISLQSAKIYPNPNSDGRFKLEINGVEDFEVEVYNAIGKKVFESLVKKQMIDSPYIIDISNNINGIYYLSVKSDEARFYQKLIKH